VKQQISNTQGRHFYSMANSPWFDRLGGRHSKSASAFQTETGRETQAEKSLGYY